jgi:hypothetical protein
VRRAASSQMVFEGWARQQKWTDALDFPVFSGLSCMCESVVAAIRTRTDDSAGFLLLRLGEVATALGRMPLRRCCLSSSRYLTSFEKVGVSQSMADGEHSTGVVASRASLAEGLELRTSGSGRVNHKSLAMNF